MRRVLLCLALVWASPAAAQSPDEKVAADALFNEGKRLMKKRKTAEACAKFEASVKLYDRLGARLNLADCWDKLGKTASAWSEFLTASVMAQRAGDKREAVAQKRMKTLEGRLARLTISLAEGAAAPGLEVRRDDLAIDRAALDTPLPIDPGEHRIQVSAPGRVTWTHPVTVAAAQQLTVTVPVLEEVEAAAREPAPPLRGDPAPPGADRPGNPGKGRRILGLTAGGLGLAAIGVGAVFGLSAKSDWDAAHTEGHCDADHLCDQAGFDLIDDAHASARLSTIAVGAGVVAVAAGAVLYLTAPKGRSEASVRVAPTAGRAGVGLAVSGGF